MKTSCGFRFFVLVMCLFWSSLSDAATPVRQCLTTLLTDNVGSWTGTASETLLTANTYVIGQTDDRQPYVRFTCVVDPGTVPPNVVRVFVDGVYTGTNATACCSSSGFEWTAPSDLAYGVHVFSAKWYDPVSATYGPEGRSLTTLISTCAGGPVVCAGDQSGAGGGGTVAPEGFVLAWMGLAVAVFGVGFLGGVKV